MSDTIIAVENLGKCYRLHHEQRERYTALRDVLTNRVKGLFGKRQAAISKRQAEEDFWALKEVSFEIKPGEVVGVIGRNGAGKSTLLKILSRITEPTTGRIRLSGRVASLLEVGTGFHPELTGRENVFLNGAILGMTRAEIKLKFDEIVAFAEVDKFLDTPVKRYSSGMYVRLAFAVAAHLEPEILIVDEVLAVGDAEFQKKCLGKMSEVSKGGRTVLFVSHNMTAVASLCSRALLMEGGRISKSGHVKEVTDHYLAPIGGKSDIRRQIWHDKATAPGDERVRVHKVEINSDGEDHQSPIEMDTPFRIGIEYWNQVDRANLLIEIIVRASDGTPVFHTFSNEEEGLREQLRTCGLFRSVCLLPGNLLNAGRFDIEIYFLHGGVTSYYSFVNAGSVTIQDTRPRATLTYYGHYIGNIHPRLQWDTKFLRQ